MKSWFEELMSEHQRRATRHLGPRLIAFYWNGSTPSPRELRDVSKSGFFMVTDERWYNGTVIRMTLQRTEKSDDGTKRSIAVLAKVIRSGDDGVAFAFVFPRPEDQRQVSSIVADGVGLADQKALDLFLRPVWPKRLAEPGGGSF